MTFNLRKQAAWCGTILLFLQVIPFSFRQVHAETKEPIDEQVVQAFQSQKPDYLNLVSPIMTSKTSAEIVQAFSFVTNTFKTVVGQPVTLQFTSQLAADQVLVRVPQNGQIYTPLLANGESAQHSHGEYWTFQTPKQQTTFTLPVAFKSPGKYFLTIDHDADHFYLEVEEASQEIYAKSPEEVIETEMNEETQSEEAGKSQQDNAIESEDQIDSIIPVQSVIAIEKNLDISEELIKTEEARILEETRDIQNRSNSTVRNWSGFRSAWNSGSTTTITLQDNVAFSSSILGDSLNVRSNSIELTALASFSLDFLASNNTLAMSSNGNLTVTWIGAIRTSTNTTATTPVISHSGAGTISIGQGVVGMPLAVQSHRNNTPVVSMNGSSTLQMGSGNNPRIITGGTTRSPLNLSGTSSLVMERGRIGSTSGIVSPIESSPNSNIYIRGANVTMTGWINLEGIVMNSSFSESWHSVDAHIRGANGSIVVSSTSNPNDFSERYLFNFNHSGYRSLIVGASSSDGFNPPLPSHALMLQASPSEGGRPTAGATTIIQGSTTTIQANPNETFDFIRWEIVSGTGSSIASATNATTTFTMGTSDTTLQAVYQRKQGGDITVSYIDESMNELAEPDIIRGLLDDEYKTQPKEIDGYSLNGMPENASGRFTEEAQTVTYTYSKDQLDPVSPLDPLDPDKEVDPENPPVLPEDQGAFSIDFVSQFNFGSQVISTQDQTYYAQAQRLLKDDGTVDETEERPNYIQVSDRRSENQRDGWTLSVRQLENFQTKNNDHELIGASLRFLNQQVATAQDGTPPGVQETSDLTLIPGEKHILLQAKETEGAGTWIYRFGDAQSADQSVALDVPKTVTPNAAQYKTTLNWELSAVPDN
ncbi:hypothetical protein FQS90_15415 [Enterococcus casseliflavus]|uniref:WxL domain-containing protein n=2 Tax=Enterococcus sp. 8E11_MSG4843 TaxID=1834190 RepID=UPI000B3E8654|nr:WxL domain-containing protein [Enterococcus sp. 8E11_MSG4843]MBO1097898.1 hypothetical protein [Enterococcus casseliflavus]MBO1145446.1 hypothetical protein [Enterococcus casseliflavus]OUZ30162.1 hypothetical protein A5885_003343 [Enterococcus sp. 8E11_MSG4843]